MRCIRARASIVLVPEISLTPQTVERFRARFQNQQITVLHSNLSAGERHDQWHKIRDGQSHIVIGARSAVFAPVQALGLIVIDEEHETSYKQDEAPRYNARDIAVMRAKIERAAVVLGTATPALESFYNARRGRYTLASLPSRVDNKKMPIMRIIDMRQEAIRQKGLHVLSRKLRDAIQARLDKTSRSSCFSTAAGMRRMRSVRSAVTLRNARTVASRLRITAKPRGFCVIYAVTSAVCRSPVPSAATRRFGTRAWGPRRSSRRFRRHSRRPASSGWIRT
jgi:primosomal protein N'